MPSPMFSDAVAALEEVKREAVTNMLNNWLAGSHGACWKQIAENLQKEVSLEATLFGAFLADFGDLLSSESPEAAWKNACSRHYFKGAALLDTSRPRKVGRAAKLDQFVEYIRDKSLEDLKMTRNKLQRTLIKHAGKASPLKAVKDLFKKQTIGGPVTFGTFHEPDDTSDPFQGLTRKTRDIRTAFGLGQHDTPAPYLLLSYDPEIPGSTPLHRPTVADAVSFSYYRPHADPTYRCGYTFPLPPNSSNLPPCPEIVHGQITGEGMVYPYELTTA